MVVWLPGGLRAGRGCPPENTDVRAERMQGILTLSLCLELLCISISVANVSLGFKRGKSLKEVKFKAFGENFLPMSY